MFRASVTPPTRCQWYPTPLPQCHHQKYLQTFPSVPWGRKLPPFENHCSQHINKESCQSVAKVRTTFLTKHRKDNFWELRESLGTRRSNAEDGSEKSEEQKAVLCWGAGKGMVGKSDWFIICSGGELTDSSLSSPYSAPLPLGSLPAHRRPDERLYVYLLFIICGSVWGRFKSLALLFVAESRGSIGRACHGLGWDARQPGLSS